jgi:diguanylate cyclase (GGDEF)-like protein/PAS domain S-box-containing protein
VGALADEQAPKPRFRWRGFGAIDQRASQQTRPSFMTVPSAPIPSATPQAWWSRIHGALMPDYNRKATVYWWVMVSLGVSVLGVAIVHLAALGTGAWLQILVGCLIAMLAGIFPVRVPGAKNAFAAGEIFIFLLLLIHGPEAAALAAAGEAFVGSARSSKRWTSRLASPAMAAVAMSLSGWALVATLAGLKSRGTYSDAMMVLAVMFCAIVYFLINTVLVSLVIKLKRNEALQLHEFFGSFGWVGTTYAVSSLIAGLLFLTFREIGVSVVAAAVPIIAMLLTMLHYHFRQRETDAAAQTVRVEAAEREAEQAARHVRELQSSEQRFHSAFSHAAIGMALVSTEGRVIQGNPALCHLLGRAEEDVVGRTFSDFVHPEDVRLLTGHLNPGHALGQAGPAVEMRCRHAQGHQVWIQLHSGYFSEDDSAAPCLILQAQDITARRDAESRLHHIAYHDALTSLANRMRFGERLAQAIERCQADPTRHFAVMYLDFDRFKLINDTLGHSAGDQFLVKVAQRIQHQVRPRDTVGRLGGDEFAILIEDMDDAQMAVAMADRLQESLRRPYQIDDVEVDSSASIGITFSSIGYTTPGEVLRDADIAMYRAKASGRARYAIFDASLRAEIADQVQLERDLRRAIERDELSLAYQPIYDLKTGRIDCFEALVRWNHPERGPVAPASFIPIAEDSGVIGTLTEWVLSTACRQLIAWHHRSAGRQRLRLHVNVSGLDMCRANFISQVATTLLSHGVEPSLLTLEITESMLMKRLDSALENMNRLRHIGVGLSVDDFGTGYSSLSYLSTLPITSLKIDRSFVQKLQNESRNGEVVRAIVTLGVALGKTVIAEGIETPAELNQLRALGCGYGQGYLLARPLSAESCEVLLQGEDRAIQAAEAMDPSLANEPIDRPAWSVTHH